MSTEQKQSQQELETLRARHRELYQLVELYLTAPSGDPAIAEHFDNLCEWFSKNKTPDGFDPLPLPNPSHCPGPEPWHCG